MRTFKNSSGCENLETKVTLSGELWEAFAYNPKYVATLIANMPTGFAYCKIITSETGKAIDYMFINVNMAFERIFELKKDNIIGKRATEVFPSTADNPVDLIDINWLSSLTQKPVTIEKYLQITKKWHKYSVYSPKQGYFISIFEDITEHKKTEAILQENERLKMALEQCAEQIEEIVEEMVQERIKQLKEAE